MAEPSSAARAWLDAAPASDRVRLERLHALVLDVADEVGAAPVIEETKWGQPSFRASNGKESTPVRLAWNDEEISILVHCQTTVISDLRATVGDRCRFDGSRAMLLGPDDPIGDDVAALIAHALTYRR